MNPDQMPRNDMRAESITAGLSGDSFPRVGTECRAAWLEPPDGGSREPEWVLIKGRYMGSDGRCQVWFCTRDGEDIVKMESNCRFLSPKEEAVQAMADAIDGQETVWSSDEWIRTIYNAIRDGKIPGVRLEDPAA